MLELTGVTLLPMDYKHFHDLPEDPVEAANIMCRNTLVDRMGITFTHVSGEKLVATMPVDGNTQPLGLLHGGAHGVLAETLGSVGADISAGPGRTAVGVELNASHHRPAFSGLVTGTATRITSGKTVISYEIVVTDEAGRRLSTARLTCMARDMPER